MTRTRNPPPRSQHPGLWPGEPYRPTCRTCGAEARRGRKITKCAACKRLTCECCLHGGLCQQCHLSERDEAPASKTTTLHGEEPNDDRTR